MTLSPLKVRRFFFTHRNCGEHSPKWPPVSHALMLFPPLEWWWTLQFASNQLNMAKVIGYYSYCYLMLYGKGEGILQMLLRSLMIYWLTLPLKKDYLEWVCSNWVNHLQKSTCLPERRLCIVICLSLFSLAMDSAATIKWILPTI